jgi:hypothetical protein
MRRNGNQDGNKEENGKARMVHAPHCSQAKPRGKREFYFQGSLFGVRPLGCLQVETRLSGDTKQGGVDSGAQSAKAKRQGNRLRRDPLTVYSKRNQEIGLL